MAKKWGWGERKGGGIVYKGEMHAWVPSSLFCWVSRSVGAIGGWVRAESRRRSAKCITCTHKRNRRRGGEAPRSLFPPTEPLILPLLARDGCQGESSYLLYAMVWEMPLSPRVLPLGSGQIAGICCKHALLPVGYGRTLGAPCLAYKKRPSSPPPPSPVFHVQGCPPSPPPAQPSVFLLPLLYLLRGGETLNFLSVEHERISVLQQSLT